MCLRSTRPSVRITPGAPLFPIKTMFIENCAGRRTSQVYLWYTGGSPTIAFRCFGRIETGEWNAQTLPGWTNRMATETSSNPEIISGKKLCPQCGREMKLETRTRNDGIGTPEGNIWNTAIVKSGSVPNVATSNIGPRFSSTLT